MMSLFSNIPVGEIIKYAVELIVLLLILREIRELRKHHRALEKHEAQLNVVRPLFSSLYTATDEIMDLAVSFTEEAKEIYALGSISSLLVTEMKPGEDEAAFKERTKNVNPKTIKYVAATREHILEGRKYCRVMDFQPTAPSEDSIFETLANVNFFLRLWEFSGTSKISLELYHTPDILKGRGDFHFRCSDRQVVLRAGGHGNQYANAAIVITDTRVVHEFQQYYQSLIHSKTTRHLEFHDLKHLRELLLVHDIKGIENYLSTLKGAKN